jgi:copper homeostasis protein
MHALIRPRFGDFCYTAYEYLVMKEEVRMFRELGAEGVVIGILNPEGTLDMKAMSGLMEEAEGMSVTLHRAFDMSTDPYETMEQAISLGMDTILTSGQKNACTKGIPLLKCLVEKSGGRICIQAGGGVNADAIRRVYPDSGVTAYHMSGKEALDSAMRYRKKEVNMGLPSLSEYTIYRTGEENIRQARKALEEM